MGPDAGQPLPRHDAPLGMALRSGNQPPTYAEADLRNQCAGFAYGWKKIAAPARHRRHPVAQLVRPPQRGTLRIGLRRYPDDAEDPGGKKPIWGDLPRRGHRPRGGRPSRLSSPSSASPTGTFCNPSQTETDEKTASGRSSNLERPDYFISDACPYKRTSRKQAGSLG